jgi:hypothetical protein
MARYTPQYIFNKCNMVEVLNIVPALRSCQLLIVERDRGFLDSASLLA